MSDMRLSCRDVMKRPSGLYQNIAVQRAFFSRPDKLKHIGHFLSAGLPT
jgi:hypothetical protein